MYLCAATCVSILLRASTSLVLPPAVWPAVNSCACLEAEVLPAVAVGLVLSGVGLERLGNFPSRLIDLWLARLIN